MVLPDSKEFDAAKLSGDAASDVKAAEQGR
jgi:hypothetical protein